MIQITLSLSLSLGRFVEELGLKTTKEYGPWMYEGQVGGFAKRLGNLTYTTVRAAGHMVPSDQPGPAQQMFYQFLVDA